MIRRVHKHFYTWFYQTYPCAKHLKESLFKSSGAGHAFDVMQSFLADPGKDPRKMACCAYMHYTVRSGMRFWNSYLGQELLQVMFREQRMHGVGPARSISCHFSVQQKQRCRSEWTSKQEVCFYGVLIDLGKINVFVQPRRRRLALREGTQAARRTANTDNSECFGSGPRFLFLFLGAVLNSIRFRWQERTRGGMRRSTWKGTISGDSSRYRAFCLLFLHACLERKANASVSGIENAGRVDLRQTLFYACPKIRENSENETWAHGFRFQHLSLFILCPLCMYMYTCITYTWLCACICMHISMYICMALYM